MALSFTYRDPYLASLVSTQNEEDAISHVVGLGFTDSATQEILVPLRSYILCCISNVKAPDDIFSTKLKLFRTEFDGALALARNKPVGTVTPSIFSISIARA